MKKITYVTVLFLLLGYVLTAHAANKDLGHVWGEIGRLHAGGFAPVAVLDLDETLIDSSIRRVLSIDQAARELATIYPWESALVSQRLGLVQFNESANKYDVRGIVSRATGLLDGPFLDALDRLQLKTYLSDAYMAYDKAIPCAQAFVKRLFDGGVYIVFVSSRLKSRQTRGTLANLNNLGIIRPGERYKLILRPDGVKSIDFKEAAFRRVEEMKMLDGKPVAVVYAGENEPENMNSMIAHFRSALKFFVKGAFLKPEPLKEPVFMITNYCY